MNVSIVTGGLLGYGLVLGGIVGATGSPPPAGTLMSIDPRAGQILGTIDPSLADPRAGQILNEMTIT